MNSSTSNSEKSPIFRSVLVFALLFAAYNGFLAYARPDVGTFQNQWDKNAAIAEDYIAVSSSVDWIIAGSSLAARLEPKDLGPGAYNLAFSGGTAATALEIILRSSRIPNTVLVETNVIRRLDTAFLGARFSPISRNLKKWFPSARIRYRPANLLLTLLKGNPAADAQRADPRVPAILLDLQKRDYSRLPEASATEVGIAILARQVAQLQARGAHVAFFEMPIDSSLRNLPRARYLRNVFLDEFPRERFTWINMPLEDPMTTDGLHLQPRSALAFSEKLRSALRERGLIKG